jgi:hypothetical protein
MSAYLACTVCWTTFESRWEGGADLRGNVARRQRFLRRLALVREGQGVYRELMVVSIILSQSKFDHSTGACLLVSGVEKFVDGIRDELAGKGEPYDEVRDWAIHQPIVFY